MAQAKPEMAQQQLTWMSPRHGSDGIVPEEYRFGLQLGYNLSLIVARQSVFNTRFRQTLSKLANRAADDIDCVRTIKSLVFHFADTAIHPKVVATRAQERRDMASFPHRETGAANYCDVGKRDVWLCEFLLKTSNPQFIACTIIHEAAHAAGAPSHSLAEYALYSLECASGLPRLHTFQNGRLIADLWGEDRCQ